MERQQIREMRDRTRLIVENLQNLGIRVPKGSRLRRYVSALDATVSAHGIAKDAGVDVALLHHLFVEVNDFDAILRAFGHSPVGPALRRQIGRALSGNPHRTDDNNSAARDWQFELVVAATLLGSYRVHFTEPDLRCHSSDEDFGVAVKRVRSATKVRTRLKEAAKQIANSTTEGVIVVDVSCVINPDDDPLVAKTAAAAERHVETLLNNFTVRSRDDFLRAGAHSAVFGLIFHVAIPVVVRPDTLTYQRLWATTNVRPLDHLQTAQLCQVLSNVPLLR